MNATLGHVLDHQVPNRDVVNVLIVRAERRLRPIRRRPAGSIQDRAVLADKGVAGLRGDRAGDRMHAGLQTESRSAWIDIDNALDVRPGWETDGANWARDGELWANHRRRGGLRLREGPSKWGKGT